ENGGMPARHLGNREVEGHDGMDGKNQWRRYGGQDQVGPLVILPMPGGSAPTKGENGQNELFDLGGGPVAQGGQVGNQSHIPEQEGNREIGAHREYVPKQRAAEIGPYAHAVRNREHPVNDPDPSDVDG